MPNVYFIDNIQMKIVIMDCQFPYISQSLQFMKHYDEMT